MYFYCTYTYLGTGYFLKIAKINSQKEKPICPNRKNQFPQNTKNRQSAKINSPSHRAPRAFFFSPSPQPPYDTRGLCRGERAKKLNVVTNTTVLFRCHTLIKLLYQFTVSLFSIIIFLVIFHRNVSYTETLFGNIRKIPTIAVTRAVKLKLKIRTIKEFEFHFQ